MVVSYSDVVIRAVLCHPDASPPRQMTRYSAGYDVSVIEGKTLYPGDLAKLDTGLMFIMLPPAFVQLQGRSSVFAGGLLVHNGLIDADFRETVKLLVRNVGRFPVHVRPGDRLAQFRLGRDQVLQVERLEDGAYIAEDLSQPPTREGGIGSTGRQ